MGLFDTIWPWIILKPDALGWESSVHLRRSWGAAPKRTAPNNGRPQHQGKACAISADQSRSCSGAAAQAPRPSWMNRQPLVHHGAESKALFSVASPRSQTSVFISQAGEQKKGFVDVLCHALTEEGISVFVDEHSLVPGTPEAWESIIEALTAAAVGVACCAGTQVAYDPAHCPA